MACPPHSLHFLKFQFVLKFNESMMVKTALNLNGAMVHWLSQSGDDAVDDTASMGQWLHQYWSQSKENKLEGADLLSGLFLESQHLQCRLILVHFLKVNTYSADSPGADLYAHIAQGRNTPVTTYMLIKDLQQYFINLSIHYTFIDVCWLKHWSEISYWINQIRLWTKSTSLW